MVAIIKADPYRRYKALKIICQTSLIAKCVVERRDTNDKYVMVIAPTKDKNGNSNDVKHHVSKLLEIDHPGIVRVFEAYEFEGYCYSIMNDWTVFKQESYGVTSLTEEQVVMSIHKMTTSLLYLQDMDIILGNLTFDEMRFSRYFEDDDNDYLDILIVDLGICRHVDPKRYLELHQDLRCGKPPEAREGIFTKYSDIWTLGSTAYHLLTGDLSTDHLTERVDFNLEESLRLVSVEAKDFCLSCLKIKPEERISIREAMAHPWFTRVKTNLRSDTEMSSSAKRVLSDISKRESGNRKGYNFLLRACRVGKRLLEISSSFTTLNLTLNFHGF
jgi:calcium/calmodulin-dependent protein kinase I